MAMSDQDATDLGVDVESSERLRAERMKPRPIPEPHQLTAEEEARRESHRNELERRRAHEALSRKLDACFGKRFRYRDCSLANYRAETPAQKAAIRSIAEYCDGLSQRIECGDGVLLFGPPGTGKDHLLAHLMNFAIRAGKSVKWVNGMDLFGEVRDRMDDERQTERQLVEGLVAPQVLAISDPAPPFGKLTEFQGAMLFRIIDGRYSARLPTWVTLNAANAKEMDDRIGPQVVDRLTDGALVVPCNWATHRKARV